METVHVTDAHELAAVAVVQLFNTVTKIADALQLQPDFDPRSNRVPKRRTSS